MPLTADQQIPVHDLKRLLDSDEPPTILDVRELSEFRYCNLGGVHIPLGTLPLRLQELDPAKHYAVLCHHGNRSYQATMFLLRAGFTHVQNVSGGIDAWSLQVDPSVPRY